jgi:hypothetical protein
MPGIGKSEAGIGAARILKRGNPSLRIEPMPDFTYIQWQATTMDILELGGLPAVIDGKAVKAPFHEMIPQTGRGMLIIDEINGCDKLTQAQLLSLIWNRQVGVCKLGDGWMIICTGNQDKDGAYTQKMITPMVSRMNEIIAEYDVDVWLKWMAEEGGHEHVISFIKYRPNLAITFDPSIPGPFATARTWKSVSDLLYAYDKDTPPPETIQGWVGAGPSKEFMFHLEMADKLVKIDDILKDPAHAKCPDGDPGAMYAIATGLAGRFNYDNCVKIMTYLERMPKEYSIYCVKTARTIEAGRFERMSEKEKGEIKSIRENRRFKEWCVEYHHFLIS